MYKSAHFKTSELVPKALYDRFGESAARMISPLLLVTMDHLREVFGSFKVNSYNSGQHYRGLRTVEYYIREAGGNKEAGFAKYMASLSMHNFGCAADMTPLKPGVTIKMIHDYIKTHPNEFPFLAFVETDVTWLHIDVRNNEGNRIHFWSVKGNGSVFVEKDPIDLTVHIKK